MILVDTSVWVNHFRDANPQLSNLLDDGRVLAHPWVTGELALGGLSEGILSLLQALPTAEVATVSELLTLIRGRLTGTGVGYVDAQLIASARLTSDCQLWTADRRLRTVAASHVPVYPPAS